LCGGSFAKLLNRGYLWMPEMDQPAAFVFRQICETTARSAGLEPCVRDIRLLLSLDAGILYDIGIPVDLGADEFGGLLGRRNDGSDFTSGETLLDRFRAEDFGKGLTEAFDDVFGCAGRSNKPIRKRWFVAVCPFPSWWAHPAGWEPAPRP
jgi:hypothetical protein